MNTTSATRMTFRRAAAACVLIAGLTLAGCATPAPNPTGPAAPAPVVEQAPKAPAGIDTRQGADRVAEDIERNRDRMQELSKRFAGVPADRVEEELQREAAEAEALK